MDAPGNLVVMRDNLPVVDYQRRPPPGAHRALFDRRHRLLDRSGGIARVRPAKDTAPFRAARRAHPSKKLNITRIVT